MKNLSCLLFLSWLVCLTGCEVRVESSPANPPSHEKCPNCPNCPNGKCGVVQFTSETAMAAPGDACPFRTVAPVEVPLSLRQQNYGGGSCMYAALITVLRSQRQYETADYVRANYCGAGGVSDCSRLAEQLGLRYAYTTKGNEDFLEWCSRTRRAAAIYYGDNHAVTFLGYTGAGDAVLLDNNQVEHYENIPKATFLTNWHAVGGNAIATVYASNPRRPWYVGEQE
jgi:hypothetical protein